MIIYLIGLPSSGKSTLGRQLAKELAYDFLDLDLAIEEYEGMSIPEIFSKKGEDYFRDLEKKVLHLASNRLRLVIATGGGAPCFFDNMEFILKKGKSFYFDISIEELLRRLALSNGQADRPLLVGKDLNSLKLELEEKKKLRDPFYKRADFVIEDDRITVEEILKHIKK